MRKNFGRVFKSVLALTLCVSLILSLMIGDSALAYISNYGSTHIYYNEERELAKGVVLNKWQGKNQDGTPTTGQTITFNPRTSDAMLMTAFGARVNNRTTLSSMSKIVEQSQGVSIIGGINADFYYLENGIPIGLMIQNGKLMSYSNTKWNAIGFKEDGSVVIGSPNLEMKFTLNETEYPFSNFNKAQNDWGPYLYSSDFGPNTASTVPSIEAVLDITLGETAPGKMVIATVREVRKDTKATPIGANQLVFSARNGKAGYLVLSQLKPGDTVTIQFNDPENKWTDVKQAVGGDKILISNGSIASGLPAGNYNPTTAVGVKANGDVVFYQVDGRSSNSKGVSSLEAAQFLHNLGCVQAIQLDGGGSSAMIARMPGHSSPGLLNNPSDGSERANSNSLLLISRKSMDIISGNASYSSVPNMLHVYPYKTYALPNAAIEYYALATNADYLPATLPQNIKWNTSGGAIDAKGTLIAGSNPGTYQVSAAYGHIIGTAELTVLDRVTSLKSSKGVVTLLPGASVDLDCDAYYNNIRVRSTDTSFTWQVEGNIGTITNEGVFTMAQGAQGKGRIIVKYGNVSAAIEVVAAASPDLIEDFENDIAWGTSTIRARTGKASVVKDQSLARSGNGLLKLDYDFTLGNGVEKGIAGVYAYMLDPNSKAQTGIPLKDNPTAIGMWVYGDNGKSWLRASVKDANGQSFYIDFTPEFKPETGTGGIDWTGWKYVEAQIPSSRKGPFILETPIRVMCSRDEYRTKGTLYFDQIRAVYGISGKDEQAPVAKVVSPANQAVLDSGVVPLNIELSDGTGSGVDLKSIQVTLDAAPVEGLTITGSGILTIKGELGTALPLADGLHNLTINYSDLFGNKGSTTVMFMVETGAPQLLASTSPTVVEGGTFTTTISVKNPKDLRKIYTIFTFDTSVAEVVDADAKTPGKQVALEPWARKGKIITHSVDEKHGRVVLEIDNIAGLNSNDIARLGTITFKPKSSFQDSSNVSLLLGAMIVGKNPASQRFCLPSMTVKYVYPLNLEVTGTYAGETTVITVTDQDGKPVEGAEIYLNSGSNALWATDKAGQVRTSLLTRLPLGTSVSIRAMKNNLKSNQVSLTISEKSGN